MLLTSSKLLSLEIANAKALLFARLIATLRFFLKSFCFFLNRIARYAQSKELEIFLRKFRKSLAKQFLEIAYILTYDLRYIITLVAPYCKKIDGRV